MKLVAEAPDQPRAALVALTPSLAHLERSADSKDEMTSGARHDRSPMQTLAAMDTDHMNLARTWEP